MTRATILLALAVAMPGAAHADTPVPRKARHHADEGRRAHDRGDYDGAIAAFKEAYVIAPAPGLLFNLAQAYRLRGDCDDAALMYRRYLASAPPAEEAALASVHLVAMERCIRERPGRPIRLATPLRPAQRTSHLPAIGVGLAVAGIAALGIAGYEAAVASSAEADVEAAYGKGGHGKALAERDAEGRQAATTARAFGVAGGLALAGGIAVYFLGRRAERMPPVAVAPAAGGARVSVAWRF